LFFFFFFLFSPPAHVFLWGLCDHGPVPSLLIVAPSTSYSLPTVVQNIYMHRSINGRARSFVRVAEPLQRR